MIKKCSKIANIFRQLRGYRRAFNYLKKIIFKIIKCFCKPQLGRDKKRKRWSDHQTLL